MTAATFGSSCGCVIASLLYRWDEDANGSAMAVLLASIAHLWSGPATRGKVAGVASAMSAVRGVRPPAWPALAIGAAIAVHPARLRNGAEGDRNA